MTENTTPFTIEQYAQAVEKYLPEQLGTFNKLRERVREERATIHETQEYVALKQKAAQLYNEAQRLEQLNVLASGDFSAEDIIRAASTFSKKDWQTAIKQVFTGDEPTQGITLLIIHAQQGDISVGTGRWSKLATDAIKTMAPSEFVAALTEDGRRFLSESTVGKRGERAGQTIYPNLEAICKRAEQDSVAVQAQLFPKPSHDVTEASETSSLTPTPEQ